MVDTRRHASAVHVLARNFIEGDVIPAHAHPDGQFVHAVSGVMEIRADRRLWVVPPQRAVWIPPGTVHEFRARTPVLLRTLYIASDRTPPHFGQLAGGFVVTALVRELILRAIHPAVLNWDSARILRLHALLLDELNDLPSDAVMLAMPSDPRLVRACEQILDSPSVADIDELARSSGASTRTLSRLAREELGCPLSVWRQQARIVAALPMLIAGESILSTALSLGYETPSAFTAMFKRLIGTTPTAFVAERSGSAVRPER
ncbi:MULTISPECIES: AraC family transcriptional regulator [unclassified Sphingobium]|uniref:AraC family transcriptional regulator n=1 Tax=unclassified Sphingobium TaxID=2611147 RepID=UPI0019196A00|nr:MULTISPECIES: helix-turn-helix transcriptional regulator [unclassified Sphingobium]CAD7339767.1 HTH-type transcriptional regulator NimR [Sphingobium sp. S8]CAD7340539.1 HTH-type transcriptional regulator NimR [Sphingobium sp. S6]